MKNQLTEKESKQLNAMSKNMQKFLNETKGIPSKIIQLNSGETIKDEDGNEQSSPAIYSIVDVKNKKESKKFNWQITFDLNDKDEKNQFKRILTIDEMFSFNVSSNSQLIFILNNYIKSNITKEKIITKEKSIIKK